MCLELYTYIISGSPKIERDACMVEPVMFSYKVCDLTHFKCVMERSKDCDLSHQIIVFKLLHANLKIYEAFWTLCVSLPFVMQKTHRNYPESS